MAGKSRLKYEKSNNYITLRITVEDIKMGIAVAIRAKGVSTLEGSKVIRISSLCPLAARLMFDVILDCIVLRQNGGGKQCSGIDVRGTMEARS